MHFPATVAFLVWMYLRRSAHYLWSRQVLTTLTAAALAVHLLVPVAPPRMLVGLGFADTAARYGPEVYRKPGSGSVVDQYAAMPSLHVGWAVVVAAGLILTTSGRWRWLWLAHPVVTALVVIGTGNHFWLDEIVATGLLALTLPVLVRSFPSARPGEMPSGPARREQVAPSSRRTRSDSTPRL